MRLRFRKAARADLQQIVATGLDLHGPAQTRRYRLRMNERLELLRLNPGMGRARNDMGAGTRSLVAGVHIVFYEIIGDDIVVLRSRHQHEDWLDDAGSA